MKLLAKLVLGSLAICAALYCYSRSSSHREYLVRIEPQLTKPLGLLDLPDFHHVLVPVNACRTHNVSYVQIVTSYAGEVSARSALRRAYPSSDLLELGVWRVFLLARIRHKSTDVSQQALEDENRRFGDVLQGSFHESYRNLTYKHIMGLNWASTICPSARYIFKMDDDIVVNMYKIVEIVSDFEKNSTFDILGYVFEQSKPIRLEANKWYVSKEEFVHQYYPKFVSGWFYVTRPSVAMLIVDKARSLPYFWIDDVFVTGIAAELAGVQYANIGKLFTTFPEHLDCCIARNVVCDYVVGPSGGDFDLQLRFEKLSKNCESRLCSALPPGVNISQVCVAKKVLPQLRQGHPSLRLLKLK